MDKPARNAVRDVASSADTSNGPGMIHDLTGILDLHQARLDPDRGIVREDQRVKFQMKACPFVHKPPTDPAHSGHPAAQRYSGGKDSVTIYFNWNSQYRAD